MLAAFNRWETGTVGRGTPHWEPVKRCEHLAGRAPIGGSFPPIFALNRAREPRMGLRFLGRPPTKCPMLPNGKMGEAVGIVKNHRLMGVRQNLTQSGNARGETPLDVFRRNVMTPNLHAMTNSGQSDFRGIHADIKEPNPIPQRIRFPNARHRRFPRKRGFLIK